MTKSATERRKEKQQLVQNLIFDTTTKLRQKYPFEDITIRMICEEAGISTGMFYRNFDRKSDILPYYYEKALSDYKDDIENDKNSSLEEMLLDYYLWLITYTAGFGTTFIKDFYTPSNHALKKDSESNEIAAVSNRIIRNAVKNGKYTLPQNRKVENITHDLLIIIRGILLDWYLNDASYDIEKSAEEYLMRVIQSILK